MIPLSKILFESARHATGPAHAGFLRECAQKARQLETAALDVDVREAHVRFESLAPMAPAQQVEADVIETRRKYIREEFEELMEAIDERNMVKIVGECIDLIYVTVGTLVALGIPMMPFWNAIHRANMRKVPSGQKGGKWVKPDGWMPANLHKILYRVRQQAEGVE